MRARWIRVIAFVAVVSCAGTVLAQFGHPLKGTWSGEWGPTKDKQTHVVLDLNWDGKALSGTINPGPNAVKMQKVELDPSSWMVHFEAEGKDPSGKPLRYVVDGKLENIGAYQRFITGTWTEGGVKGDFKVVRN